MEEQSNKDSVTVKRKVGINNDSEVAIPCDWGHGQGQHIFVGKERSHVLICLSDVIM